MNQLRKLQDFVAENFQFILLATFTLHIYFNDPSIGQAIVALGIVALSAQKVYLKSKVQPNYVEMFSEKMEKLQNELNDKLATNQSNTHQQLEYLAKEQKDLKDNYTKKVLDTTKAGNAPSSNWRF